MDNKGKLAEARHVDRQLPEISYTNFKLLFCLVSLTILCVSATAQENTTEYWMDQARDQIINGSTKEALSSYDKALEIDPENATIWIRKALELQILGKENESLKAYETALGNLDEDLRENPQDARAWMNKALALSSLGRQNESVQPNEKALDRAKGRVLHAHGKDQ